MGRSGGVVRLLPRETRIEPERAAYNGEMADDCAFTSTHYHRIAELSDRLSQKHFAIYEHQYRYLAFGSWQLVAGTRKRRFRFTWDGRERFLQVEVAAVQSGVFAPWSPIEIPPHDREGTDPIDLSQRILENTV